jgi:type IV pilus assembly protein PilC
LMKVLMKKSPSLRYRIDVWKLKIRPIGPVIFKLKMARFCNYFALMYTSGITVLDAIVMGKHVMSNAALETALDKVHEQIAAGESISLSFANVGLFPALVVRMLRVGENTGAMGEALLNVSYFYDREVKDTIDAVEPMVMPAITIFLGAIIGWIIVSVMGPIYDAIVKLSAF